MTNMTGPIAPLPGVSQGSSPAENRFSGEGDGARSIKPGIAGGPPVSTLPPVESTAPSASPFLSNARQKPDEILEKSLALLKSNQGIVYGENHSSSATADWMRANLKTLKMAGVTTLFMEIKDQHQPVIERFMQGKADRANLRAAIAGWNADAFCDLIVEAKAQGIKIIAMDVNDPTPYKYEGRKRVKDERDLDRLDYSNPAWAARVRNHIKGHEKTKFIMLCGAEHTKTLALSHPARKGVDVLLAVPSIDIYDSDRAKLHNSIAVKAESKIPEDIINSGKVELTDPIEFKGNKYSDYLGVIPLKDGNASD